MREEGPMLPRSARRLDGRARAAYPAHLPHQGRSSREALAREVQGTIGEIVPSVDAASRTITVKVDLPAVPGLRWLGGISATGDLVERGVA